MRISEPAPALPRRLITGSTLLHFYSVIKIQHIVVIRSLYSILNPPYPLVKKTQKGTLLHRILSNHYER